MTNIIPANSIQSKIHTIRDKQVMLDEDLAKLYQVETKNLNRAVKRNISRFPSRFRFQLTKKEFGSLRFQDVTLEKGRGKHRKYLPYVFTEQGVSMLSAVLQSKIAIKVSVQIIDAFVNMRRFLVTNADIFNRLDNIDRRQLTYQLEADHKFNKLFKALEAGSLKPKQGIFYNGQIFDAHVFISDLIKGAKKSIILIDNFIDESVLQLFVKRKGKVEAIIYTKNLTPSLELDLEKFNSQHESILVQEFKDSHDRFLIIDHQELYHIGASLKDLGKKWFAFSRMDGLTEEVLGKIGRAVK